MPPGGVRKAETFWLIGGGFGEVKIITRSLPLLNGELKTLKKIPHYDAASLVPAHFLHRRKFCNRHFTRSRPKSRKGTEHQSLAASWARKPTRYILFPAQRGCSLLVSHSAHLMSQLPGRARVLLPSHLAIYMMSFPLLLHSDLTSQQCPNRTLQSAYTCAIRSPLAQKTQRPTY